MAYLNSKVKFNLGLKSAKSSFQRQVLNRLMTFTNKMRPAACGLCKQRIATNTCIKCGSSVCERCFDNVTGLCVACRRGKFFKK